MISHAPIEEIKLSKHYAYCITIQALYSFHLLLFFLVVN